jgi:hypothetical protein
VTARPRDKPIRLSAHASGYRVRRGFTEVEVEATIRAGPWLAARNDRLEATKDFPFNGLWNGRHYAAKRVRPVFVEEDNEIVVITVYTYFF